MTTICAMRWKNALQEDVVTFGTDTVVWNGAFQFTTPISQSKIIRRNASGSSGSFPLLIATAGGCRFGDIMEGLDINFLTSIINRPLGQWTTEFHDILDKHHYLVKGNDEGEAHHIAQDSYMIMGYRGKLWQVNLDFSIFEIPHYVSIGSGSIIASAILRWIDPITPLNTMYRALLTAAEMDPWTKGPFDFCDTNPSSSGTLERFSETVLNRFINPDDQLGF